MATILETLEKASRDLSIMLSTNQKRTTSKLRSINIKISNSIELIKKGYNVDTHVDSLIDRWYNIHDVPDLDDNPDMGDKFFH